MMSVRLCCWRNENVLSFYTCLIAGRLCGSGLCVSEKSILEFPGRRDTYKSQLGGGRTVRLALCCCYSVATFCSSLTI